MPVAKGRKERVEQGLQEYKRFLLTRKAVDCEQSGKKMSKNPYIRTWYEPATIREIFAEVKGNDLYDLIYKGESEKTHWSSASLGRNIAVRNGGYQYAGDSSLEDAATVLGVGFQAMIETLAVTDNQFELSHGGENLNIMDSYVADLNALRQ